MLKKNTITLFVIFLLMLSKLLFAQNNVPKNFVIKKLDSVVMEKKVTKMLFRQACQGYPFCRFSVDSLRKNKHTGFNVYGVINPCNKVIIKNIYSIGEKKISPNYIAYIIGIKSGDYYNEKKVKNINKILSADPLLEVIKESGKEFFQDGADLFLYINALKINTIRAMASLNYDEKDEKYYIVGSAEVNLKNNFLKGEELYFSWAGYNRNSQNLDLNIRIPAVFKTYATPDISVFFSKIDTLCLNIRMLPKIFFRTSSFVEVGVFADFRKIIPSSKENLLGITDTKTQLFGVETVMKGGDFTLKNAFSFGSRNKKTLSEAFCAFKVHQKFFSNFFYDFYFEARSVMTKTKIFYYEQYPLGGPGSIRGFERNQFYADRYALVNNDLGYTLWKKNAVVIFYDFCFHDEKNSGLGTAFRLSNSSYELNFAYAVPFYEGKMQPLKAAKFHIFITLKI